MDFTFEWVILCLIFIFVRFRFTTPSLGLCGHVPRVYRIASSIAQKYVETNICGIYTSPSVCCSVVTIFAVTGVQRFFSRAGPLLQLGAPPDVHVWGSFDRERHSQSSPQVFAARCLLCWANCWSLCACVYCIYILPLFHNVRCLTFFVVMFDHSSYLKILCKYKK